MNFPSEMIRSYRRRKFLNIKHERRQRITAGLLVQKGKYKRENRNKVLSSVTSIRKGKIMIKVMTLQPRKMPYKIIVSNLFWVSLGTHGWIYERCTVVEKKKKKESSPPLKTYSLLTRFVFVLVSKIDCAESSAIIFEQITELNCVFVIWLSKSETV